MKIFLTAFATCILLSSNLQAQTPAKPRCGIDEIYEQKFSQDPNLLHAREASDAYTRAFIQQELLKEAISNKAANTVSTESKYVIPTVVHVIHSGAGSTDSISVARVEAEFEQLFNNFRRVPGTYGYGGGVDTKIEFCLATKDPQGNPTNGVNYVNNPAWADLFRDDENVPLKTTINWDNNKYFNIWLVKKITSSGALSNLAGYAQFPWDNSAATDGVVVIAEDWGVQENTGAHELGHWVNLYHPFQGGCPNTNCSTNGDGVCDTPPVIDLDWKDITQRTNTCNNDSPDLADIQRIYMDYTSDDKQCNIFTKGQALRAKAAVENTQYARRFKLWQESNLEATGTGKYKAPVANFWSSHRNTCVNQPVTFYDYSRNQAQEFEWSFPGGTPATSTEVQPTVVYAQPGTYEVSVTVKNLSGESSTFTRPNWIIVTDKIEPLPYTQAFSSTAIPSGWSIINPDSYKNIGGFRWSFSLAFGSSEQSMGAARMENYFYNDYNQVDGLVSPSMDFSNAPYGFLTFNYAYAPLRYRRTTGTAPKALQRVYTDTLAVMVSTDCGATWNTLWKKGGMDLATRTVLESNASGEGGNFEPVANDWRYEVIDLGAYKNKPNVRVMFQNINGWGNNIYLDDVRVTAADVTAEDNNLQTNSGFYATVVPNPTNELADVVLRLTNPAQVNLKVYDVQGRLISDTNTRAEGTTQLPVNLKNEPAGIYLAHITINNQTVVKKIAKL